MTDQTNTNPAPNDSGHSGHFYNADTGQSECDCCTGWALDYEVIQKERDALKLSVAALEQRLADMRAEVKQVVRDAQRDAADAYSSGRLSGLEDAEDYR